MAHGLEARERAELEAHARSCPQCADALRNASAVDSALRAAFASLRERRAMLAPGRVRLAVASEAAPHSLWVRAPAFFARLAEVSVTLGVTLFVLSGSVPEPQQSVPAQHRSVIQEYFKSRPPTDDVIDYFRWLRVVRPEAPAAHDTVHLPAGGLFDTEQPETVKPTTSPR